MKKRATECAKVPKSVKKRGFHIICATIRIGRESQCLPYAEIFNKSFKQLCQLFCKNLYCVISKEKLNYTIYV